MRKGALGGQVITGSIPVVQTVAVWALTGTDGAWLEGSTPTSTLIWVLFLAESLGSTCLSYMAAITGNQGVPTRITTPTLSPPPEPN